MSLKALLLSWSLVACAGDAQKHSAAPPPSRSGETPAPAMALRSTMPQESAPAEASESPPAVVVAPPEPIPEPIESSEPPPNAASPPPVAPPSRCTLEASVKVTRQRGMYHVSALLRNLTAERLEFDVPGLCPLCLATFSGLPTGYEYDPACAAGVCPSPLTTIHYSLPPGVPVEVDSIDIDPVQTNCRPSVRPGRYQVSFSLPTAPPSVRVCGRHPGTIALNAPKTIECPSTYHCPPRNPCF